MSDDTVYAVDLFCGGGGLSTALALACEEIDRDVELTAVNHWTKAIETHQQNHPWAEHCNAKVEELHPPNAAPSEDIDILVAAPECTHFSTARGGKPVKEQKRASPWHVLDWLEKLTVENILLENVPELQSWGPVDEEGQPTRNGEIFDAWVNSLHALGYSVDWTTLNAADYGDATSRERLFVVGRRGKRAEFPTQSHSEHGDVPGTDPWRPAAEIIDWSDPGESIWQRTTPLVNNTMQRIAEGLRRHGSDDLNPYADTIDELGKDDVEAMQADVVDAGDVHEVAEQACEPFLVKYYGTATAKPVDEPVDTITSGGGKFGLCTPYLLGQHSGSVARDATERPTPTIAAKGAIGLYRPETFVLPRNGPMRGLHSNTTYRPDDRPLHTVTASNHDGHLVTPFLVEYYGNGGSRSLDEPLPTVTTKDRFALVLPEQFPLGLDIRFRMLQPRELAAAMGFPEDYEFAGNKTETTKQIGNAVPVNLGKALCQQLLIGDAPSLTSYGNEEVPADD